MSFKYPQLRFLIFPDPVYDHNSSRKTRKILNEKTNNLLVRVREHRIDLLNAPDIPWLKDLYPDIRDFLIPLPEVLGMNGAWQWYKRGVKYPVLEKSLHPFYGVYFPVRTEHLVMFDNWMAGNAAKFRFGLDIGTGCGILALIMAKHGIKEIYATDINPNAVLSASNEFDGHNTGRRITVEKASLFGSLEQVRGLVVFNPPWIPGVCMNMMDRGIYYEEGFFENFFAEAEKKMAPGSTLAIIFSSYAVKAGIADHNPIEKRATQLKNFVLEAKITEKVTSRTRNRSKSWINRIRENEETELWVFKRHDA